MTGKSVFILVGFPVAALAAWFAVPKISAGEPSCCNAESSRLVCTKTGEALSECCCVTQDGTLVCTKTGEVLSECCCMGEGKADQAG